MPHQLEWLTSPRPEVTITPTSHFSRAIQGAENWQSAQRGQMTVVEGERAAGAGSWSEQLLDLTQGS